MHAATARARHAGTKSQLSERLITCVGEMFDVVFNVRRSPMRSRRLSTGTSMTIRTPTRPSMPHSRASCAPRQLAPAPGARPCRWRFAAAAWPSPTTWLSMPPPSRRSPPRPLPVRSAASGRGCLPAHVHAHSENSLRLGSESLPPPPPPVAVAASAHDWRAMPSGRPTAAARGPAFRREIPAGGSRRRSVPAAHDQLNTEALTHPPTHPPHSACGGRRRAADGACGDAVLDMLLFDDGPDAAAGGGGDDDEGLPELGVLGGGDDD